MESAGCPAPAELAEFLVGKLPRTRTAWIAEHVQLCSRCESSLQALDQGPDPLLAALGSTVREDPVPAQLIELARAARKVPPPTKLGRFEFLGEIGSGSYGTVFKARDAELGRTVAIKLLRASRSRRDPSRLSSGSSAGPGAARPSRGWCS